MKNNEEKLTLMDKVTESLIKLGDTHARRLSIIVNYYEPKIPMNLLKNEDNKE